MGFGRDLNSRIAQMPPLIEENQQLDESKLVDSLANKAPKSHKAMLISQGFNPETGGLAKFIEHCKRTKTTDSTPTAIFSTSDEDSETKRKKKRSMFKEHEENGKKRHKKNLHSIALYMTKKKFKPLGTAKSSRKGLKINTILSIQLKITILSTEK